MSDQEPCQCFEDLKIKVLDQRSNLDNMADRVIALEDQLDKLTALTDNLLKKEFVRHMVDTFDEDQLRNMYEHCIDQVYQGGIDD